MLNAPAVNFTITIPSATEEQRLKEAFVRQLSENETIAAKSISSLAGDEHSLQRSHPTSESLREQYINLEVASNKLRWQTQLTDGPEQTDPMDMPLDTAMELVVQQILRKFDINNAIWLRSLTGKSYQISFTVEFNEVYESLYDALQQWGIGDREGSSVSVMNCIASNSYKTKTSSQTDKQTPNDANSEHNNNHAHKHGGWNRFMNSVRSRLNVAQIVRDVRQDAAITFDFCILLISAAILASFGLVENSTIFLASSMLISPLMGPIIAAIFGTVIAERSLRKQGMRNELIGILMATLVGFLFGLVMCSLNHEYGIGEGLTEEMLSRCELRSLVVGLFTAIPSGAAAAIGILGGNIGSLVGVAISASLLPPAVNSGLLWALACVYKLYESDETVYANVIKSRMYSDNQATELAVLGSISMCLTLSNVLCIYVMGILVLKAKQIAPVIGRSNRQFWMHDIKLSRSDAAIIDEMLANLATEDKHVINDNFLRHLDDRTYQHTWSPHTLTQVPPTRGVPTIQRLEQLYTEALTNSTELGPALGLQRRHTLRSDKQEPRPRLSSMPSNGNRRVPNAPATIVNLPTPRFTVTPATDDTLRK